MLKIKLHVPPSEAQWCVVAMGMRNPLNSWDRSDSDGSDIGEKDKTLMKSLIAAGPEHRKFLRQLPVIVSVTAPLYWWKEADTYKVGTVANSTSTMHTIAKKEFSFADFSTEHLNLESREVMEKTIEMLNKYRERYLESKDKEDWWQMIQLLPSSYNQTRTLSLNYEVLRTIYHQRKNHKLNEWQRFLWWIEKLPNADLITEG